jgi:hypothetical protein
MIIANPIYDVVFKYLLDDTEIARALLSTIMGSNITHLQVKPQETLIRSDAGEIKIFHLDFKAVIDLGDGTQKTVLVELQKARKSFDIMRFRKYLGENYIKEEVRKNQEGELESFSLEIVTIYILGFKLAGVDVPVLKVGRRYINAVTSEEVQAKHEFIDNLTHESYMIQIPRLKHNQQNRLEEVLEVFSQDYVTDNLHRIEFGKESKNPLVKKIVKRLSKAAGDEAIQRKMDAEDMMERILRREINAERAKHEAELLQKDIEKQEAIDKERQEKQVLQEMIEDLQKQLENK